MWNADGPVLAMKLSSHCHVTINWQCRHQKGKQTLVYKSLPGSTAHKLTVY